MLKRLVINQKIVPVPIPVRTLSELCAWVDEALVPVGETVTSAVLDGKDILDLWGASKVCESIGLHQETRIELRIESPEDLALQSLEAIHSLAIAILGGLKALAVHLWQARKNDFQPELIAVIDDVQLIGELMDRLWAMGVSERVDLLPLSNLVDDIKKISSALDETKASGDWKASAQILLRDTPTVSGLESLLKRVSQASELAHYGLLSSSSAKTRTGSASPS